MDCSVSHPIRITSHLRRLLRFSRSLAFPDVCPACLAEYSDSPARVCRECRKMLPELPAPQCTRCGAVVDGVLDVCAECQQTGPRPWEQGTSVFSYGGYVRELVHRFKYNGGTALTPFFARRMADAWLRTAAETPDLITPVPLHWMRRFQRGYNQAGLLATRIGRHLQIPVHTVLTRTKRTRQQAQLDMNRRRQNVEKGFKPRTQEKIAGARILLVDDVFTTGATLAAAATALKKGGAERVSVLTLARG